MVAQPVVRHMVGSIWTPDPTIVAARHVAGSIWTADALALPTAKASAAMLALINANVVTPFTTSNLVIGAPQPASFKGRNTTVLITAQPSSGYSGQMNLYYNRRTLASAFASTQWLLGTIASATTIRALIPAINTAYGTNLDPTDVVDGPVAANATSLSLTAASGSYVFLAGTTTFLMNSISLAAASPVTQLAGFTDASGTVGPAVNYTTALLHFDSPPGLNQVTDDYGHPVTLGTAATLSTTQKKFGSSALSGTNTQNQFVSLADSPDLRLGGDFTIEFWFYMNSVSQDCTPLGKGNSGAVNQAWIEFLNGNVQVKPDGAAAATVMAGAGFYAATTWTHFALTKAGTLWTAWVNGAAIGTMTSSAGFGNLAGPLGIMGTPSGNSSMNGFIDEVRITNGLARYTATFTPPAAAFPTDASATALLHLDSVNGNTLVDATGAHTPLLVGTAALVTTGQAFGAGAVNIGGGATAAVMLPDAPEFRFTADFCIEMMFFPTSNAPNAALAGKGPKALWWYAAGGRFQLTLDGSSAASISVAPAVALNQWHHVALTRELNTWRIWVDGAVVGSFTGAGSWGNVANNLYLGNAIDQSGWGVANAGLAGLIDEIRVTSGWCRYSPNFNVPVAPYVMDGNGGTLAQAFAGKTTLSISRPASGRSVKALAASISNATGVNLLASDLVHSVVAAGASSVTLTAAPSNLTYKAGSSVTLTLQATAMLLHFDGANLAQSATDVITGQTVAMSGGAVISTVQSKFGGSSFLATNGGAAGVAALPDHPFYRLTGDYTIEWYSYMNAVPPGSQIPYAKDPTGSNLGPFLTLGASGSLYVFDDQTVNGNIGNQTLLTATGLIKAQVWQHIAVVVKAGVMTAYIDGTAALSVSAIGHTFGNNTNQVLFGAYTQAGFSVNGYMDEFRISNVARYSGNFTPPPQPFIATDAMTILSSVFTGNTSVVAPAGVTTIKGLANAIAKQCGVNLTADDLVDGSIGLGNLQLTVAPTSYTYLPGSQMTIVVAASTANVLMHFDGVQGQTTTVDEAGHALTMVASSLTTTNKKFGTTAFQGAANGYITTPDAPDLQMNGDFTFECFWTPTAADLSTGECILFSKGAGSYFDCFRNAWYTSLGEANVKVINAFPANLVGGVTYHIAYTRQGTLTTIWVNGVAVTSANSSLPWGVDTAPFYVNAFGGSSLGSAGQIDEVRVTNGFAVYTAAFTPPSQPFVLGLKTVQLASAFASTNVVMAPPASATTILALVNQIALGAKVNLLSYDVVDGPVAAGATSITLKAASTSRTYVTGSQVTINLIPTVMLLHFDGANGSSTTTDAIGHPMSIPSGQISTTQSKFGGSSFYYNLQTAGMVSTPDAPELRLGVTGDFTVELFAYPLNNTQNGVLFSKGPTNSFLDYSSGSLIFNSDQSTNVFNVAAALLVTAWNHVALVKASGVWYLFVNGALLGTNSAKATDTLGNNTTALEIGNFLSGYGFQGYIDEFRISNIARYTAAFTPPSLPFVVAQQSVQLAAGFTSTTLQMGVESDTTILALVNLIASKGGANLLPIDVVDGQVPAGTTSLTLTAAASSPTYVTGSQVTLTFTGNTLSLLHFDGANNDATTTDAMGNAVTITGAGRLSTTQTKFGATSYAPNSTGNLAVTDPGSMSTPGDFTLEMFVFLNSLPSTGFFANRNTSGGAITAALIFSGNLVLAMDDGSSPVPVAASSALPVTQWNHVAWSKQGTTVRLFVNGVLKASANTAATWGNNHLPLIIGSNGLGGNATPGFFDEVRYSSIARYTANFTPPAAPFVPSGIIALPALASAFSSTAVVVTPPATDTTIAALIPQIVARTGASLTAAQIVDGPVPAGSTSVTLTAAFANGTYASGSQVTLTLKSTALLMHFDNPGTGTFVDECGHTVAAVNGVVGSATAKFGTGSYPSGGTGQILTVTDKPDLHLAADFTFEFQVMHSNITQNGFIFSKGTSAQTGSQWIGSQSGLIRMLGTDGSVIVGTPDATKTKAGAWQHVAFVRKGNLWSLYIDGVLIASVTNAVQSFGNNAFPLWVGAYQNAGTNLPFAGFIDELRISQVARYTANFTPPAAPFTVD